MFGGGSSGSSTGYPWNIDVFPFSFHFSEGLGHKYPTLSLSVVLNLAHGGRVCVIRCQESMCGN